MAHTWAYQQFGWTDLTPRQTRLFEKIEMDLLPLRRDVKLINEAALSDEQINLMFSNAENISRQKGMRTDFGKVVNFPKETMIKINKILDDFGKRMQESTVVKNFDEKFDQAKAKLRAKMEGTKSGKIILQRIDQLGELARTHPGWQSAILGVLVFIGTLATGLGAAPVIAAILAGLIEGLKGSKFSTIVGKAAKVGAISFITAQIAGLVQDWIKNIVVSNTTPPGLKDLGIETLQLNSRSRLELPGYSFKGDITGPITVKAADADAIREFLERIQANPRDVDLFKSFSKMIDSLSSVEYANELQRMAKGVAIETGTKTWNGMKGFFDVLAAAATGTASGAAQRSTKPVTEKKRLALSIMEGLWADLTLKFGAGNLRKAWMQAGRPTDSVDIARMMAEMGMEYDDIRQTMIDAGVSEADAKDTMDELMGEGDTEIDAPFTSGIRKYDVEALRILRTKGQDAFVSYWETKLAELERSLPADPSVQSKMISDLRMALKANDIAMAKDAVLSQKSFSSDTKKRLLGLLVTATNVPEADRKVLADMINNATITEMDVFYDLSSVLKEAGKSWADLGYRMVVRERRTNSVILL